jgi:hypothetical protein
VSEDKTAPKSPGEVEVVKALKELNRRLPEDMPEKDRKAVLDIAKCLLKGDPESLDELHRTCCGYAKDPERLKDIFDQFGKLWKSLDLGDLRVTSVLGKGEKLVAIRVDIPIGQNNYLRLASTPGRGGFVVHDLKLIDEEGKLIPVTEMVENSNPFGAARRISRNMVDAIEMQQKEGKKP